MAVGGLGVTLAGFAGLISALERREAGFSPVATWRIRRVVYAGFGVTFVGFTTVALYTITEDVALTVRLATIGLVLSMWGDWRAWSPSGAWPDDRRRRGTVIGRLVASAVALVNVALASVGFLQLLLLLLLSAPASIFMLAVADVTRGDESPDNDTGGTRGLTDARPVPNDAPASPPLGGKSDTP